MVGAYVVNATSTQPDDAPSLVLDGLLEAIDGRWFSLTFKSKIYILIIFYDNYTIDKIIYFLINK